MFRFIKSYFKLSFFFSTFLFFLWFSFYFVNNFYEKSHLTEVKKQFFTLNSDGREETQKKKKFMKLNLKERYCKTFNTNGFLFNEEGVARKLKNMVTSCLIHSFSPQIEFEASRRFLDPARGNVYYANSPAVHIYKGEVILVSRIWLDREKYEKNEDWPANQFADNWLYYQRFDQSMKPVSNGSILGIPTPKQWWVGDGPIEPRLFSCQGELLMTFNTAMVFKKEDVRDFTVIWNLNKNLPIIPDIEGGSPMLNATERNDMPRDKHWMALTIRNQLFFVHNLDPLRVLKCQLNGKCKFVHKEYGHNGFIFSDAHSHLRGGTPFELYRHPYYVSVAHTTMYKDKNKHRFYSAHLVVISVFPFRVVYISQPINLHKKLFKMAPIIRNLYIDEGFLFPVGLIVENEDSLAVGAHINDFNSIIIRIKNIKPLMQHVISLDEMNTPLRGPPPGFLNSFIHHLLENITKVEMLHEDQK